MFTWTRIKSLCFTIVAVSLVPLIQTKSNAQSSDKPNIYIGVRDSVSSDKYCNDLLKYLEEHHQNFFDFKKVKIEFKERLYQEKKITQDGNSIKLAIECGSNTITINRQNYLKNLKITLDGTNYIEYPGRFSKRPYSGNRIKNVSFKRRK